MRSLTPDEKRILSHAVDRTRSLVIIPQVVGSNETVDALATRGFLIEIEAHDLGDGLIVYAVTDEGMSALMD
ncbi:MAG: hypothetical protein U1E62_00250 [Alsobacter sp.]